MSAISTADCRYIYVMGGYDGSPLNVVEKYDASKDCWEFETPLKTKRFMHESVMLFTKENLPELK